MTQPSTSSEPDAKPAAQYIRMSTEHQQYSTENQADVIREYAKKRGFRIVKTYADEGKSGLRIEGRNALRQMIDDVQGADPGYEAILAYQREVRVARYLVSLTPAEEFAAFLAARGHCAFDNRHKGFAARCYENACCYDPTRPSYSAWFLDAALASNYWPRSPELNYRLVTAMNERNRNRRDPLAVSVPTPGFSGVNEVPLPSARPRLETGAANPIRIESRQQPQPTVPANQVPPVFQNSYQDQHLRHGSQP